MIQKGANVTSFELANGDLLFGPKVSFYRTIKELTPNGVFGNPLLSSVEKVLQIGASVTKALKGLVLEIYALKDRKYISS